MLIDIDALGVSLGGVRILHDVRLSLEAGEIYGLLGPNGAGKSTTIAAALGLIEPNAGRVRVFGTDPGTGARAVFGRIGVLPEQNGFYDWMSAEAYLGFFASLYGRRRSPNELRRRIADVGLEARREQAIGTYSRGMRQRLGLARALIADPKLLILDEPTNGLDPRGRREIHDILLDLAGRGVGILLCTHLLDDVERLCRRIGVIVDGRTVAQGDIADLVGEAQGRSRFRLRLNGNPPNDGNADCVSVVAHEDDAWFVELAPTTSPDDAWRSLLFRGWPIVEIRREAGGDLETLYLSLTERQAA